MRWKLRPLAHAAMMCSRTDPARGRLWSPSDLTLYAESPWAAWFERLSREEPSHRLVGACDPTDAFSDLLGRKGAEAEAAVLHASHRMGQSIIDLSAVRGPLGARVEATARAIAEEPDIIYQAPLLGGGFYGIADFLVRLPRADEYHPAQYMVWDAKLGSRARPSQVLQLCCYSEMLERLQGGAPEWAGLILGGNRPLTLRLDSYSALYRHMRGRFLESQAPHHQSRANSHPLAPLLGRELRTISFPARRHLSANLADVPDVTGAVRRGADA